MPSRTRAPLRTRTPLKSKPAKLKSNPAPIHGLSGAGERTPAKLRTPVEQKFIRWSLRDRARLRSAMSRIMLLVSDYTFILPGPEAFWAFWGFEGSLSGDNYAMSPVEMKDGQHLCAQDINVDDIVASFDSKVSPETMRRLDEASELLDIEFDYERFSVIDQRWQFENVVKRVARKVGLPFEYLMRFMVCMTYDDVIAIEDRELYFDSVARHENYA